MPKKKRSEDERLRIVLYIMGNTPNSRKAAKNLRKVCEHIQEYDLEVVDIQEAPERIKQDQVIAVPTLIKVHPEPQRRVVGDLSDGVKVRAALGLDDEVE
ncbi:MAG: circadian clock KaiB family protein [Spirochaetia bacterium]|nr:circadian clock KaiB family protein [Spirochaetia bacterium]